MTDIIINNAYPAVQYEPTETTGTPVYHEDREVTLTGAAGSQMFRTYNAQFNPSGPPYWSLYNTALPGFATVQNPDGSIHYFTIPAGSSAGTPWAGSSNNAVYNAVDYGMSPSNSASANQIALQAVVTAAGAGGGVVFIPPGTYPITGETKLDFTDLPPGSDKGIIITGAGGNSALMQNDPTQNTFSFTKMHSGNGVRFKDLSISYALADETPETTGAAIYVSDCQNVSCERVFFSNCPQSLYLDNQSEQCGLFNCTIYYNNTEIPNQNMVYLGGSENFIESCDISQKAVDSGGPTGCTAVVVQPAGGLICIANTHLSDFTTGILVYGGGSNLTRLFGSNIICESWANAVIIKPTNSSGTIYDVFFDDCLFAEVPDGSTEPSAVGVYIDTNGGLNSNVANIFLNNCLVYGWSGSGVQINAGENIVITGGRYGSNATAMATTGGGIAVTGTAANVTIDAADCTPIVPGQGTQLNGIFITAAVAGLYVRGCNLTGYGSSGPIYTSSAGTQIEITDCAGYNDMGTVLQHAGMPPSTISNTALGYYGPIAFYVSTTGTVTIGSYNTYLSSGGFTLSPGQTASVGGTVSHFLAVGQ